MKTKVGDLYGKLKKLDYTKIVAFMTKEGTAKNHSHAVFYIDALLQWLAAMQYADKDKCYVMVDDNMDDAHHAFILNTRFYLPFCDEHFGGYVHHTPLDRGMKPDSVLMEGIDYTLCFLDEMYGQDLHPTLRALVERNTKSNARRRHIRKNRPCCFY